MKKEKIAVVMGGISNEREISLASGAGVSSALERLGYSFKQIDLTQDLSEFVKELTDYQPDIVFNALHGHFGEDGHIQSLLNNLHIPYTHSGVEASAIGMDKAQTKEIAKQIGVPVADGDLKTKEQMLADGFPLPYVAKPNDEGSSLDVHIVKTPEEHINLLNQWPQGTKYLVETYIPGHELSVAVLNNQVLGTIEIVPKTGFYDYTNKYTDGQTSHLTPAPLPEKDAEKIEQYALAVHQALGCRGVSRCDFRYDDTNKEQPKIVFLEINTNPGMTPLSLVPDIAKSKKITYDALVNELLKEATCD